MDPDFLQAQVLLAEAYGRVYWLGEDPDGRFATKASAMVADIARRWPDRPESRQAHAQYTYTVKRDHARALTEFQALQVEKPSVATGRRCWTSAVAIWLTMRPQR